MDVFVNNESSATFYHMILNPDMFYWWKEWLYCLVYIDWYNHIDMAFKYEHYIIWIKFSNEYNK